MKRTFEDTDGRFNYGLCKFDIDLSTVQDLRAK